MTHTFHTSTLQSFLMSLAVAQAILDCKGDYNFLGDVEIPEEWQDDEQDAGAPDKNEQEETA